MYLLAINQALSYGCSIVTSGHPEGSAAGDITIIWNDVFKLSVDCSYPFLSFIYFLFPSPSHGVPLFSDLRILSLSFPLCQWLTSIPFLLLVYCLFFCWIFAVALVWRLGIKFQQLSFHHS